MDINLLRSLVTLVSFVTFLGICLWAWSGRRRAAFAQAAALPFMEDPDEVQPSAPAGERETQP